MPQVFIVNVFANASHPFVNPLNADGTFDLIPIPEGARFKGRWIKRYTDLKCYNSDIPLTTGLPDRYHKRFVHDDPDLAYMTYGDVMNPRSGVLEQIAKNDWVAFYALLTPFEDGKPAKRERGFYIVAAFEVKQVIRELPNLHVTAKARLKFIRKTYGLKLGNRILENAHTRRWLVSPSLNGTMRMIIVGGRRSRRFLKSIPLTRALCGQCFIDKYGKPWRWDKTKLTYKRSGVTSAR